MNRTRIKICGVGRVEDALAAAHAGADAIGIVFHKASARYVTPDAAREIVAALPPFVTPVGLFVDAPVVEVRGIARSLGLRHVQLHGRENSAYVAQLREFILLKAIRADRATFIADLNNWREEIRRQKFTHLHGLVLETPASAPGGTGIANDWAFLRECRESGVFAGLPPVIVAGGLTPENVAAVVGDLQPWAVDVSSGVEVSKGIKSRELIDAFVKAVCNKPSAEGVTLRCGELA